MLLDYNKKVWGLVDKDNGNLLQTDIIEGGQDFAFDVDFDWWEGMDIEWEILADNENLNYEAGPNDEQLHYLVIELMLADSYGFVAKDQILWNTKEEALNTKGIKEVLENDKDAKLVEMTIADVVKRSHLDKYELRGPEFWQLERKAANNVKTEAKTGRTQVDTLKDYAVDNEIAFISACRPNDCSRTGELVKDLQDMGLDYLGVTGFYEDEEEQSFAVFVPKGDQVTLNKVLFDLGEKYNQDSVGLVRQPLVIEAAPDSPYGTYLDGEKYLIDMDFFSRKDRAKLENKRGGNQMKVVLNKDKDIILHIDLRDDNYPDLGFADSWLVAALNHLKNKGIRQPNPRDIKDALIATMDDYTLFGIADFVNGMNIDDRNINAEEGRQIVELAQAELYYMLTDSIYGMNRLHDRIKRHVAEAFTESKVFDRDSDQFYEDTLILDRIFYFLDFIRHEEDSDMAKAIRVKGRIKNYARQAHDKALKQALHDLADSIEGELNWDEFARVADTAAFLHDNYKEQEVFTENKKVNKMRKQRQLNESLINDDYYFNIWVRNYEQGEVDNFLEVIPSLENGTFEEDFALAAGSEGFLISDWEMTLDYNLGTYAGEVEIEAIGNLILEAKEAGAHLLLVVQAYLDRGVQPQDIDLNGDYHVLENEENTISLDSDLGYTWENHIGLDYTDKENYFDYEAYGRDIRIGGDLDSFIADHLLYDEEILDGKDGWDVVSEENADLIVDDYLRERVHDLFTMSDYALGVDFTEGLDPRELPTNYFDYEAFGRDLGFDYDYVTVDVHGHLALDGWVRID